jgi:hypothetical protein
LRSSSRRADARRNEGKEKAITRGLTSDPGSFVAAGIPSRIDQRASPAAGFSDHIQNMCQHTALQKE